MDRRFRSLQSCPCLYTRGASEESAQALCVLVLGWAVPAEAACIRLAPQAGVAASPSRLVSYPEGAFSQEARAPWLAGAADSSASILRLPMPVPVARPSALGSGWGPSCQQPRSGLLRLSILPCLRPHACAKRSRSCRPCPFGGPVRVSRADLPLPRALLIFAPRLLMAATRASFSEPAVVPPRSDLGPGAVPLMGPFLGRGGRPLSVELTPEGLGPSLP